MTWHKSILVSILLLFYIIVAPTAVANVSNGYVPVRNFTLNDYSANAQNWGCVQDSLGRIYVANGYGMLCHDGSVWRLSHLPNYTSVRSLLYDGATGRIYAGGSEEFGYFSSGSSSDGLTYTSLSDALGELHPGLTEVWKIVKADGKIWFQGDYHVFCYDKGSITTFNPGSRITRASGIGKTLYIALDDGRIIGIKDGKMRSLSGLEALSGLKITAMLPFESGKMLIGTSLDGLFVYDGHKAVEYDCDISDFLKKNQLFCASSRGDDYVFGTVNQGAVVENFSTGRIEYINKNVGLLNNTVLGTDFDQAGNLWLSLDYGLGYAVYNTPVWNITGVSGPIGAGYASLVWNNRIYLGTNQGLYAAPYPLESNPSPAKFTQLLQGQVWSIDRYGDTVFVGSDTGTYVSEGGERFTRIPGIGASTRIRMFRGRTDRAIALTYQGFYLLGRDSGVWSVIRHLDGYDDIPGDFVQDQYGDIWLAHWRKGVFRLRYNEKDGAFSQCRLFDRNTGLPDDKNTSLTLYRDHIIVSTQEGFYRFNAANEEMQPEQELASIFGRDVRGSLKNIGDSAIAVIGVHDISIAIPGADGKLRVDSTSLRNIGNKLIPGYTNLYLTPDGKMLLSGYEGFWSINPCRQTVATSHTRPFVSMITANSDSLVYLAPTVGTADRSGNLDITHDLNTLRFNFGYPDYTSLNGVEYSSYLEGYDDAPSDFSSEKSREYTKIPSGHYTFHLKSRNLRTGEISETAMKVTVRPPWYDTLYAWIIWILLAAAIIYGVYVAVSRRIASSKEALEKKKEEEYAALEMKAHHESMVKDMEITNLRVEHLEQDINHKSQELCDTVKNLIHKNEILQDISANLKHISDLLTTDMGLPAAQRKLAKIRQTIEHNLSHDNDWTKFSGNFDKVYTDFTKRLAELHPNLSIADKRLCCYIRMGLSSKEIAPLINISNKSVEMARYRVRKKIGIPPGGSLTSYLDSL